MNTPELRTVEADAIEYLLDRVQRDPDLRWLMLGTEAFARLCRAEAVRRGESFEQVAQRRSERSDSGRYPDQTPKVLRARQVIADLVRTGRDVADLARRYAMLPREGLLIADLEAAIEAAEGGGV